MASLNTLRTKGGIIVSIVIGLALVAFLLGDLTSASSRILGGRQMRVGEIDGNPVEYQEYAQEAEYMSRIAQLMTGTQSLSPEQTDQAYNMAWESMVSKHSLMPGFEKLGVWVGKAELADMTNGTYISPVVSSMFADPSTGSFDPTVLREFLLRKDADASGNTSMWWEYIKEQMYNQRVMGKYIALVTNGMFTNNLEVEEGVKAANNTYSARYMSQKYSAIADSTIKVTDSQVRKYYDDHKAMFKQNELRNIEYVLFALDPSQEDYDQAKKYIDDMAAEFAASDDPMQYATANSQKTPDQRYLSPAVLNPEIVAAVSDGGLYGPVLNGDVYTISRLASTRNIPDSIGARHILLMASQKDLADSIVTAIKGGASFAAMVQQYSLDQQAEGGDLGVFAPETMIPEISEACVAANVNDVFTVNTNYGLHVLQLTKKTAPKPKMQIATITYQVEPSSITEQTIYGQASSFLTTAVVKGKFQEAVDQSGVAARTATISNLDRNVTGLPDSRQLVRWAFNAKAGDVTKEIMEINGDYVVAMMTGATQEGVATVEQAAAGIRAILIKEEKARILSEKMQGSSLDAIASSLGAEVVSVEGLQQASFFVDGGAGVEPRLIGAICASKQGVVSKPVEGLNGVYVFEVTSVETLENATPESEKVRLDAMSQSYLGQRIGQAVNEESKVKDMRVKFF